MKLFFSRLLALSLSIWISLGILLLCVQAKEINQPHIYLWAWQRTEDLSSIDPKEFGVAYLACRIVLSKDAVQAQWRQQPLKVPPQSNLIATVRIDCDRKNPPNFSEEQLKRTSQIIEKIARLPRTNAVQIDFDALETEREFYKKLLEKVRTALPEDLPLSITALASWCLFDNWIKDLPVNETVPMMFSLGAERQKILLYFQTHHDFLVGGCCKSLGISLEDKEVNDLMIPLSIKRKIPVRIYVFTKYAWTEKKIQAVKSMLGKQ